jgi:hypothetical protein
LTDGVDVALIAGGFSLLGILLQRLFARFDKLSTRVDGRMTEMLELVKKSSHAEGVKDEKERDRTP